jgi:hypothetical protein
MEERHPDIEGSDLCIKQEVADSRQSVVLSSSVLGEVPTAPHGKSLRCYETFHKAWDLE